MPETFSLPSPGTFATVSWSPAAMPATFVACSEFFGSNGVFAYFHTGVAGANARATITLGVVYAVFPFGKPAGYVKPAGSKKVWVWSRPSSMIPIFIPLPGRRECRPPDRWRADQLRGAVEELVVRDGRPDGRAGHGAQPCELGARDDDGHPVRDDAVMPAGARIRDRLDDARLQRALRGCERAEIRDARRGAQVQAVLRASSRLRARDRAGSPRPGAAAAG